MQSTYVIHPFHLVIVDTAILFYFQIYESGTNAIKIIDVLQMTIKKINFGNKSKYLKAKRCDCFFVFTPEDGKYRRFSDNFRLFSDTFYPYKPANPS